MELHLLLLPIQIYSVLHVQAAKCMAMRRKYRLSHITVQ